MRVRDWERSQLRARSTGDRVVIGKEENLTVLPRHPISKVHDLTSPPTGPFSRAEQVYHLMIIDSAAGVFRAFHRRG